MPASAAFNNTKGHVVVVDDDPSVRKSIQTLLKREGYRVSVHDSADDLLQNLAFYPPTVLLTDMRMPSVSGVDLQTKLKALGYDLPMVFVSGESRPEEIIAAMKQGAIDFLLKPFTAQAMLDALQKAMRVASDHLAQATKANRVSELLKREPSAHVLAKAVYTAVDIEREEALKLLLEAKAATDYLDEVFQYHFILHQVN